MLLNEGVLKSGKFTVAFPLSCLQLFLEFLGVHIFLVFTKSHFWSDSETGISVLVDSLNHMLGCELSSCLDFSEVRGLIAYCYMIASNVSYFLVNSTSDNSWFADWR